MNEIKEPRALEILLVEDNPGDVELTRAALRHCKVALHMSVARDGEEAMAMLHRVGQHAGARTRISSCSISTCPRKVALRCWPR